jgi:gliding motility-associated-like protein
MVVSLKFIQFTMKQVSLLFCLFSTLVKAQQVDWAHHIASNKFDNLESHAIDKDGNIIAVGYFEQTVTIGTTSLTSKDESDIFIYKSNKNGEIIWAHTFGGPSYGGDVGVSLDGNGNIYVAGGFISQLYFDNDLKITGNNRWNSFVAKLGSSGNFLWAKGILGMDELSEVRVWGCLSTNENGTTAISGIYSGSVSLLGTTMPFNNGTGIFIAQLNTDGNLVWIRNPEGSTTVHPKQVLIDGNHFIYVTGFFTTTVAFDNFTLTATTATHSDIFIVKFDFNGNVIWAKAGLKTEPAELNNEGRSLIVDNENGDVYLTGGFKGDIAFDSFTISGVNTREDPNTEDIFIVKFNSSGTTEWLKRYGTEGHETAPYITFTPNKTLVISGFKALKLYYEEIDTNGNSIKETMLNGFGSINKISFPTESEVYLSGQLFGNFNEGDITLPFKGNADGFLLKYIDCNVTSSIPNKPLLQNECNSIFISNHKGELIEWYYNDLLILNKKDTIIKALSNGAYYAVFKNKCSANKSDEFLFEIPEISIYNVITPNGDSKNEHYVLSDPLKGSRIQVFNRWGKLVYQNINYTDSWSGDELPSGIYYIIIKNKCFGEFKSHLNIIR